VLELPVHDRGRPDLPAQYCLIEQYSQIWRLLTNQDATEAQDELARALAFDPDRKRTLAQADRIAALAARPSATR
jgi:hypothetical protein